MLNFIGRGSAFKNAEGNTSAFLKYNDGKSMILIDCGERVFSDILELGLLDGVSELDVLITHTHPDHVGSLGSLIFYCHFVNNTKVRILSTIKSIDKNISSILFNNGVTKEMYVFVESMPFVKEFVKIFHVKEIESVMFVLQGFNDKTIIYTGDTCDITAVCRIKKKYKNSIVYVDCCIKDYPGNAHLSIDVLLNNIHPQDRGSFFCMHLDNNELYKTIQRTGFNVVYNVFRAEVVTEGLKGDSFCHIVDYKGHKLICVYDTKMKFKGKCELSKIQMKM